MFQAGYVSCYEQWHQLLTLIVLLPLLLAVPALALWLVGKRDHVGSLSGAQQVLTVPYRRRCVQYEAVLLLRRLLLATTATFLKLAGPIAAAFCTFYVSLLSLAVHSAVQPFASTICNRAESLLLLLQLSVACIGIADAQTLVNGSLPSADLGNFQAVLVLSGCLCAAATMLWAERAKFLRGKAGEPPTADAGVDMQRSFSRLSRVVNAVDDERSRPLLDES